MAATPPSVDEKVPGASLSSPEVSSLLVIDQKYADETLQLVEEYDSTFGPITPEFEKKLRWKLYLHLTVLITAINLMLFVSFDIRQLGSGTYDIHLARLIRLPYLMRQS